MQSAGQQTIIIEKQIRTYPTRILIIELRVKQSGAFSLEMKLHDNNASYIVISQIYEGSKVVTFTLMVTFIKFGAETIAFLQRLQKAGIILSYKEVDAKELTIFALNAQYEVL